MSFPALDLAAFRRDTRLPASYVDQIEAESPGYVARRIAIWTERIYAQLAMRYGRNGRSDSLPFGTAAPALAAAGTAPPAVSLSGRPTLGSYEFVIRITTAGGVGVAAFEWSSDGGVTFAAPATVAPSVVLTGTGVTAAFPPGPYATDNVYQSRTPVPGAILGWLVDLVTLDVLRKRGFDPNDAQPQLMIEDAKNALAEVAQAANAQQGLFDLPTSADEPSAVTSSGAHFYSEASPYVAADRQEREGRAEDAAGSGFYGDGSGLGSGLYGRTYP